jgi:serine/threonine-protein kinase HipA
MGALCYEPERMVLSVLSTELDLHQLAEESNNVLKSETAFFEELLYLNGSSCGARPKVSVCVSADKKHILQTPHAISNEFDAWLIKFPSSQDSKDIGAIEWAYHLMAKDAGLELPEAFLFSNQYFGSKRFDRKHNQRFHMHTLCGLLHADYRIPSLDYEDVLRAVYWLTKSYQELEKAYRLAVFNVLAHNRDDHSKNFSFLMNSDGKWRFAPAYDLVFSYGPNGEHSTTVMGEGKSPRIHHLLELTEKLNILNAQDVIDHVRESIKKWPIFAERAGVTRHSMLAIEKILKEINSPLPII